MQSWMTAHRRTRRCGAGWRWLMVAWLCGGFGCGANVFQTVDTQDPAEQAVKLLEEGEAEAAISLLQEAIADDPDNWTLYSLLAAAYAQFAGLDTLAIIEALATGEGETSEADGTTGAASGGDDDLAATLEVLPDATDHAITNLDLAVVTIGRIPAEEVIEADRFKLSLYSYAVMNLRLKVFDTDGDGTISPLEATAVSEDDAGAILSMLTIAAEASDEGDTESASGAATARIREIKTSIDTAEGDTEAERLRSYLATDDAAAASDAADARGLEDLDGDAGEVGAP